MEILITALSILGIAEKILSLKEKFTKTNEVHYFLSSTADCLKTVAEGLRDGVYPNEKCAQLNYSYGKILELLKDRVDSKDFAELESQMKTAINVERLFGEIQDLSAELKEANIKKVEAAAGTFYSVASYVKLQ